jgi:hypothetical protein
MDILLSIKELAMTRMSDHVCLLSSITNSSVEGMSWSNGYMDLLNLKNCSEGLGGEDVDLNMPHGSRAQFLQHLLEHLGDRASITSIILELVNILVQKMNPQWACFTFLLHLRCNRGMHYRTCRRKITTSAMGNSLYACHLEQDWKIRKKRRMVT